jgi:hypothetical protein
MFADDHSLPIAGGIFKSCMNHAVHVRFREELGVKLSFLSQLSAYPSFSRFH